MDEHQQSLADILLLDEDNGEISEFTDLHFQDEPLSARSQPNLLNEPKQKAVDILKMIENEKVQGGTKLGLKSSRSLESLDQRVKDPNEMWKDSYQKLFDAKVKKFINGKQKAQDNRSNIKSEAKKDQSDGAERKKQKHDGALLVKRMRLTPYIEDFTCENNSIQAPKNKADIESIVHFKQDKPSKSKQTLPDSQDSAKTEANVRGLQTELRSPDMDMDVPSINVNKPQLKLPKFSIKKTQNDLPQCDLKDQENDMPTGKSRSTFKMPDFGLSGHKVKTPDYELTSPDFGASAPKIHADLDSPEFQISGHKPGFTAPDLVLPEGTISGPNIKKPKKEAEIKSPKLKIKSPKIKGGIDTPELDLKQPQTDLRDQNIDFKSPEAGFSGHIGEINTPKVKMPSLGLSGMKGQQLNMDANMDLPDMNLNTTVPNLNVEMKSPDTDIQEHSVDLTIPELDKPSGKLKMPKFKLPDLGLSGPKVKTPAYDFEAPEIDASAPKIKADFHSPDFKTTGHNPNITAPDLNIEYTEGKIGGPNVKKPNLDINAPSGKLKLPKFSIPDFKTKQNDVKIKSPKLDMKTPKNKPEINITDGGLIIPHLNMDADIDQPELNLNTSAPKLNIEMNSPDINVPKTHFSVPDIDKPSGKLKLPKFKKPDFGLSGPKLKTPDYELTSPDFDVSAPKVHADLNSPEFHISGHKPDFTAPDMSVDLPEGTISGPNLKKPNLDINAPSGKMKLPKFTIPGIKPKQHDINLKSPKLNMKLPKPKNEINTPNLDLSLPQTDVKGQNINFKSPDVDLHRTAGKLNMPKFKMPSLGLSGMKGPRLDVDADVDQPDFSLNTSAPKLNVEMNSPDIDIQGLPAELKCPQKDLTIPNMDVSSGKLKMPKLKKPDFSLSGPKLKTPDYGLTVPEMDVSAPKIQTDFDSPEFSIKSHKPDFTAPDMNINLPEGTISGPNLKKPNLDINAPSGKMKLPKFTIPGITTKQNDVKIKSPKLNLKKPKVSGGIKTPELDLKVPHLNMGADMNPDLNISKSTPKINAGLNSPDIQGDFNVPKANFTVPDIDKPSGKLKLPKFKKPDFSLSGPKLKTPDFELMSPDFGASAPKIHADLNSPEFQISGHKPDFTSPDMSIDLPEGTISGPSIKKPNLDINAPSGKMKLPKFTIPGITLKQNDVKIKSPKLNLKNNKHKMGINSPDLDLKIPQLNMDADMNRPDVNLTKSTPKLNMEMNSPDIQGDFNGPKTNVSIPDMDKPTGKLKLPKFKKPDFGLTGPRLKTPDYELTSPEFDVSAPKIHSDLNSPEFQISGHKPDFTAPDMSVDLPEGTISGPNLKKPNLDINAPSGKFKLPTFTIPGIKTKQYDAKIKSPKLNMKKPKINGAIEIPELDAKVPHLNMDADMNQPDLKLGRSAPKLNAEMNSPDIQGDFNVPKTNFTVPDIDKPSGKLKLPKFKKPDFGLSGPKLKTPDYELTSPDFEASVPTIHADHDSPKFQISGHKPDFTAPDMSVDLPKGTISGPKLKKPNLDINAPSGKMKLPKFTIPGIKPKQHDINVKSPKLNMKLPKSKNEINTPNLDLSLPQTNVKGQNINFKSPDVDIHGPTGKLNMPKFEMPSLGLSGMKGPHLDVDGEVDPPEFNLNTSAPKLNVEMNSPDIETKQLLADLRSPTTDLPIPKIDVPSGKLKMPKFKKPDFGLSGPKVKTPDYELTSPDFGASAPKIHADLDSPEFQISGHKPDFTAPDMRVDLPEGTISGPSTKKPNLDINAPSGKFKLPTFTIPGIKPKQNDVEIKSQAKINTPKVKMPSLGLSGIKGQKLNMDLPDVNLNTSAPKLNVDMKNPDIDLQGCPTDMKMLDMDVTTEKVKIPKLKKQDFGLSGPKVKIPDHDLKVPEINASAPKIKADIDSPAFKIRSGKPEVTAPNSNLAKKTINEPTFRKPNLDMKLDKRTLEVNAPEASLTNPNIKPDLDFRGQDISTRDMNVRIPKGKVKGQNAKKPNLGIAAPNFDTGIDVQDTGADFDADAYTGRRSYNFAVPQEGDVSLPRDIRVPTHQKNRSSKVNMPDLYLDTKKHMKVHSSPMPTVEKYLSSSPRFSREGPLSSDVYYNDGALRPRVHQTKRSDKDQDRQTKMGTNTVRQSAPMGHNAGYNGKAHHGPKRHYTADDICYTWKGMPNQDGFQTDPRNRRPTGRLRSHAMDLDVPESTSKGQKFNVLKLI